MGFFALKINYRNLNVHLVALLGEGNERICRGTMVGEEFNIKKNPPIVNDNPSYYCSCNEGHGKCTECGLFIHIGGRAM